MDHLLPDLRYAIASLRRTPALTLTVLLTLALGIGATTAVFTVVRQVLLAPLPWPESGTASTRTPGLSPATRWNSPDRPARSP